MKRFVGFAGRATVAHVVTYIAVGAFAFPVLTRSSLNARLVWQAK